MNDDTYVENYMSRIPHTRHGNWAATLVPYIHYPHHMHTTIAASLGLGYESVIDKEEDN